jgi:hypothetical protein
MSNEKIPESAVDQEALAHHRRVLDDFRGLEVYIPPELRAGMEKSLTPEAREQVLNLCLIAIQYGRQLEQEDLVKKVLAAPEHMQVLIKEVLYGKKRELILVSDKTGPSASALVQQLMANLTKH